MKHFEPPAWMERLLLSLLSPYDRETIAGDLHEEYNQRMSTRQDRWRTNLWYLRQTFSFVPHKLRGALVRPQALTILCLFTAMCGCWLGAMDILLRHPAAQLIIAATIVLQALVTLVALRLPRFFLLRMAAMLGCIALLWLSFIALRGVLTGANMEGYILIIAVALLVQSVLTLGTLIRGKAPAHRSI